MLKSASRNLVQVLSGALVYRAASLVLLAGYAKVLGPGEFGQLEQMLAFSLLVAPIVSLYVYDTFLSAHQAEGSVAAASSAGLLLLASLCFVLVAGLVFSAVRGDALAAAVAAHVAGLMSWQFCRNVLREVGRYDVVAKGEACMSVASLGVGMVLLYWSDLGISGALVAVASGSATAILISNSLVRPAFARIVAKAASGEAIEAMLQVSSRLVPNVLLWWGIELADRMILGQLAGDSAVGIYSAAARVAGILMAVALLMYQVWQIPAIRAIQAGEGGAFLAQSFRLYVVAIALCASTLLFLAKPLLVLFFGDAYLESVRLTAILIPASAIAALCYFFGIAYYIRTSSGAIASSLLGFFVSLSMNVILIPHLGAIAAAISAFSAFALMCIYRFVELKRLVPVRITWSSQADLIAIVVFQCLLLYFGASLAWLAAGTLLMVLLRRHDLHRVLREWRNPAGTQKQDPLLSDVDTRDGELR